MRLSAYALSRRDVCERRFVLESIERLVWPSPRGNSAGQEAVRLGRDFHRLVQRHRLGIPVRPDGPLADLWARFEASPYAQRAERSWVEQVVQFSLPDAEGQPVAFMVRYDEVRQEADGSWTILDWKTGSLRPEGLEDLWQSRLYRFALAEAGGVLGKGAQVPPEDIKLVYWLVSAGKGFALPYDRTRFEADRQALDEIARTVATRLDRAAGPGRPQTCQSCPFESFCHAPPLPQSPSSPLILPRFTP